MSFTPVKMSEIPKVRQPNRKSQNRRILEDFIASGYEAARVDKRNPEQKASRFATSIYNMITADKIRGVKVMVRGDDVYLVRTE